MPSREILDRLFAVEQEAQALVAAAEAEAQRRLAAAQEEGEALFKRAYEDKVSELAKRFAEFSKATSVAHEEELRAYAAALAATREDRATTFRLIGDSLGFGD